LHCHVKLMSFTLTSFIVVSMLMYALCVSLGFVTLSW
jgi:hypothetical protein